MSAGHRAKKSTRQQVKLTDNNPSCFARWDKGIGTAFLPAHRGNASDLAAKTQRVQKSAQTAG